MAKSFSRDKYLVLLVFPVVLYYIVFHYIPMYGVIISFKDFKPMLGILGSPWAGFEHFLQFFESAYFERVLTNTVLISMYSLFWGFPVPIVFALLLNELKEGLFKKSVQTISYLPHFISIVVIAGMITQFTSTQGIVNAFVAWFGGEPVNFLSKAEWFRTVYISSGVWQSFGWSSIIYLAAIAGIDPQLYEAAEMDGASRWRKMWHITLPGILPTVVILLILNVGNLMDVGFEKINLLYNPSTYETADVISTFVYRQGILSANYSYSTAIGLFNNVINLILLLGVNRLSKKLTETSLW